MSNKKEAFNQTFIDSLKEGDQSAFRELVVGLQDMVFNTCLGFVPSSQEAEDLTQEVFVEVYLSVKHFRGDAKLTTWIYRIAITKSLDYLRKQKRKKRFAFLHSLSGFEEILKTDNLTHYHPGIKLENQERAKVLFQAIARLPENQKIAFTLSKIEGFSYAEITEIMELSLASVESLLHRAKANLRKHLAEYYKNQ